MPQLDFYSYIYQFCWGIGGFLLVFSVLVFYTFPKGLYRELSGVVQRSMAFVKEVA